MRRSVVLLVLSACAGSPDGTKPADTGADTGEEDDTATTPPEGEHALADAATVFVGTPSTATGSAVAGPGDLDGDGVADIAVAAFYGNLVCAWYGPIAPGAYPLTDGACVAGESTYDFVGYTLAPGPDASLLVAAVGNDDGGIEAGKVYLFETPPAPGTVSVETADVTFTGEAAGDYAGISLAAPGDVDGDGVDDLLVGASGNDAGGSGAGRVYLLRGPLTSGSLADAWATFTGTSPTTPEAFAHGSLTGGDAVGDAVAGVGDLDGDGLADLALGAGGEDGGGEDAGIVWIVRGPASEGDHLAADADARLRGAGPGAYAGSALAGPGDVDGDGLADVLVAADGLEGGSVYVLLGPLADGDAALADSPITLVGDTAGDLAGWSVAGAGDLDGDDRPDVLVGAPGLDMTAEDAGGLFVVTGLGGASGVLGLGEAGTRLVGESATDAAGRAVASAGDVDGDLVPDLLTGASYNQEGGAFAGKAYLVSGSTVLR